MDTPCNTSTSDRRGISDSTQKILRALQDIRYGSVEITIHDSHIVHDRAQGEDPLRHIFFTSHLMSKVNVTTSYCCRS